MTTGPQGAKIVPMSEIIFVVEEAPEGGYTARALGESIFTETDDFTSLAGNVCDAIHCHFEEGVLPSKVRLDLFGVFRERPL